MKFSINTKQFIKEVSKILSIKEDIKDGVSFMIRGTTMYITPNGIDMEAKIKLFDYYNEGEDFAYKCTIHGDISIDMLEQICKEAPTYKGKFMMAKLCILSWESAKSGSIIKFKGWTKKSIGDNDEIYLPFTNIKVLHFNHKPRYDMDYNEILPTSIFKKHVMVGSKDDYDHSDYITLFFNGTLYKWLEILTYDPTENKIKPIGVLEELAVKRRDNGYDRDSNKIDLIEYVEYQDVIDYLYKNKQLTL